jgi:tRNA (cytidine56-2'-O)-methyltransferase
VGTGSSGSAPKARASRTPRVDVLRIGHRPGRDPRLTTHLALAARAFGADRMFLHPPDPGVEASLKKVAANWGGAFEVVPAPSWREVVRAHDGPVVHLTMYGVPLARALPKLKRARSVLFVVGGAKVPPEIYGLSTVNVAVGPQPHSEVAALAVVLDRLLGPPHRSRWKGGKMVIVPTARGKRVRPSRGKVPS